MKMFCKKDYVSINPNSTILGETLFKKGLIYIVEDFDPVSYLAYYQFSDNYSGCYRVYMKNKIYESLKEDPKIMIYEDYFCTLKEYRKQKILQINEI